MSYSICADIGGTKIYTGIVRNNRVFKSHKIKTGQKKNLKDLLNNIKKALEIYEPAKARNICLSFAGPVEKGKILEATNFPKYINGFNLKKEINNWAKKPVFIEHDGFCFTLAESLVGAGKNYHYVLGLTLGSGIGGGFSVNKKIYQGAHNLSEVGHFKITENGFKCSCGQTGHFEAMASGPALSKYYQKITGRALKGEGIHKLAQKGDKSALKAAKQTAYCLGIGLASLANQLSPEIIVIGGGMSEFEEIIRFSRQTFDKEIIYPGHKKIKIVKSKLKQDALLLGAFLSSKGDYRLK